MPLNNAGALFEQRYANHLEHLKLQGLQTKIQEAEILRCAAGQVTFRYRDSASGNSTLRTVSGAPFLWLVLQHVLSMGFRRSRNFGLLHPNCRHCQRLTLLRMGLKPSATASGLAGMQPSTQPALSERPKLRCRCCGSAMVIVRRRIAPQACKGGSACPPPEPPARDR